MTSVNGLTKQIFVPEEGENKTKQIDFADLNHPERPIFKEPQYHFVSRGGVVGKEEENPQT